MQVQIIKAQHNGTCARPATGSAFLAGHVVTVTVPTLAMGNGLLAIGDEWTELRFSSEDDQLRAFVIVAPNATEIERLDSREQHPGTPHG
jgi:hypothetical protein